VLLLPDCLLADDLLLLPGCLLADDLLLLPDCLPVDDLLLLPDSLPLDFFDSEAGFLDFEVFPPPAFLLFACDPAMLCEIRDSENL
jgi:hypothetical protein